MTVDTKCKHPFEYLNFSKMFITDNGDFGGQTIEVLMECVNCGSTCFLRKQRGNVPKEYIKGNTVLTVGVKCKNE